jgi:hypothetical protein
MERAVVVVLCVIMSTAVYFGITSSNVYLIGHDENEAVIYGKYDNRKDCLAELSVKMGDGPVKLRLTCVNF